ncbi:Conserved_hypothetical protein [Hexamita inflata]|uniref:Uncharacterized protein n=1 Tax=Hexamita inflata TaxID=28002 RepID=A0AA86NPW2_9EUKA|nr:Conserved hypothetical protein [Hexamita inflata]CAI9923013.1 Conserved hypothetical protein [Hexamita inflata]
MLSKQQILMFEKALLELVSAIVHQTISSKLMLFEFTQQLSTTNRKGLWKQIGVLINASQIEVHDYYFNTWSLQFYEDFNHYREEIKNIFQQVIINTPDYKLAIQQSIRTFLKEFPDNKCNERKIYQMLYQYAKSNNKILEVKPNTKAQQQQSLTIFENYAFQKAVNTILQK